MFFCTSSHVPVNNILLYCLSVCLSHLQRVLLSNIFKTFRYLHMSYYYVHTYIVHILSLYSVSAKLTGFKNVNVTCNKIIN